MTVETLVLLEELGSKTDRINVTLYVHHKGGQAAVSAAVTTITIEQFKGTRDPLVYNYSTFAYKACTLRYINNRNNYT
jgi:hypothetical protein